MRHGGSILAFARDRPMIGPITSVTDCALEHCFGMHMLLEADQRVVSPDPLHGFHD
jgi:hypothetical protein